MSPPATDPQGRASTTSGNLTWTRGAGVNTQTIYGNYVTFTTDGMDDVLLGAERFAEPRVINAAGQQINITVTLTVSQTP